MVENKKEQNRIIGIAIIRKTEARNENREESNQKRNFVKREEARQNEFNIPTFCRMLECYKR